MYYKRSLFNWDCINYDYDVSIIISCITINFVYMYVCNFCRNFYDLK